MAMQMSGKTAWLGADMIKRVRKSKASPYICQEAVRSGQSHNLSHTEWSVCIGHTEG